MNTIKIISGVVCIPKVQHLAVSVEDSKGQTLATVFVDSDPKGAVDLLMAVRNKLLDDIHTLRQSLADKCWESPDRMPTREDMQEVDLLRRNIQAVNKLRPHLVKILAC